MDLSILLLQLNIYQYIISFNEQLMKYITCCENSSDSSALHCIAFMIPVNTPSTQTFTFLHLKAQSHAD